jgi:hypothetical protein
MNGRYEVMKKTVKSATTITAGDPVHLEEDTADLAATGETILGIAMSTVVNGAGGTSQVEVLVGDDIVYQIDNDNDTNTFAGAGYGAGMAYDITGATGAVLVDTSTASDSSSGQVRCVDQTPNPDDTSLGLFKLNKSEAQA